MDTSLIRYTSKITASSELAQIASTRAGTDIVVKDFTEPDFHAEFDGVWAAASLILVPTTELDDLFGLVSAAIRGRGLLVASFKCAEDDWRDCYERFFCAMNPSTLRKISEAAGFDVSRIDAVPGYGRGREPVTWAWLFATARGEYS